MTLGYYSINNVSKRAPSIPHIAQVGGQTMPGFPIWFLLQRSGDLILLGPLWVLGLLPGLVLVSFLCQAFNSVFPLKEKRKKGMKKRTSFEALKVSWGRSVTNKKKEEEVEKNNNKDLSSFAGRQGLPNRLPLCQAADNNTQRLLEWLVVDSSSSRANCLLTFLANPRRTWLNDQCMKRKT